jgi:hypothetical protein
MLHDLYKLLKMTLKTEKDDKVKDHIVLSLNELDTIMRDCLFPKQTLQKKIRVLDKTWNINKSSLITLYKLIKVANHIILVFTIMWIGHVLRHHTSPDNTIGKQFPQE